MKSVLLTASCMMMALASIGCDKSGKPPVDSKYDKAVDGRPRSSRQGAQVDMLNPRQAADHYNQIGMPILTAGTQAKPTAALAPAAPTGGEAEVRAILTALDAAVESGDFDSVQANFTPEAATALRPFVENIGRMAKAEERARQLVLEKFGQEKLAELEQGRQGPDIGDIKFAEYSMQAEAGKVVVADDSGNPFMAFRQIDGQWQGELEMAGQMMLGMMGPMMPMMAEGLEEVVAGIESGSITAENFQAEVQRIIQAKLQAFQPTGGPPPGFSVTVETEPAESPAEAPAETPTEEPIAE